jgi:rubrerythrin
MKLQGSRTEQNLLAAFAGESQARNRYTYAADVARREGYEQIANLFMETAENEKEHAKRFFKYLEGGMVEITATYPAGIIGTTAQNLKAAAEGEHEETTEIYPEMARVALEEGFDEIAQQFEEIAKVEAWHEKRYRALLANVEGGTVYKKAAKVLWKCGVCGYIHEGNEPPITCPACKHGKKFFEVFVEAW